MLRTGQPLSKAVEFKVAGNDDATRWFAARIHSPVALPSKLVIPHMFLEEVRHAVVLTVSGVKTTSPSAPVSLRKERGSVVSEQHAFSNKGIYLKKALAVVCRTFTSALL